MIRKEWKISNFPEAVGCETKTSFPFHKFKMAFCCVCLNLSMRKRSKTHFVAEETHQHWHPPCWLNKWKNRPITGKPARFKQAWLWLVQKNNGYTSDPAVVWGKERGLTKRLEIEPRFYTAILKWKQVTWPLTWSFTQSQLTKMLRVLHRRVSGKSVSFRGCVEAKTEDPRKRRSPS